MFLLSTKDSTALLHVLAKLNEKYSYGIQIHLLAIDEGISGYRDTSIEVLLYGFITVYSTRL